MTDSPAPENTFDLRALRRRLNTIGMPAQTVVARECGISQSTVSRAAQGLIRTPSPGARRLWDYTSSRLDVISSTPPAAPAAGHRALVTGKMVPRRRKARRRRADAGIASEVAGLPPAELARLAMSGLEDYLADAFDPLLVIEQLSVLRRAQDRGTR